MENFKDQIKYQKLLNELIPNLDKYNYLSGSEGNVYFINDNFVVKEYRNSYIPTDLFENYFKEIQSFEKNGYLVPKFYAWTVIKTSLNKKYYILEERIKGKNLFNELSNIYSKVKHLCTEEEFNRILFNYTENPKLFTEIVISYLTDINETSKSLLNMKKDKLESFITTLYHLYADCVNSYPDIHENNVLFDGQTLTIIDQMPIKLKSNLIDKSLEDIKEQIFFDIFAIFEKFSMIEQVKCYDIRLEPRVEKIKQETLQNAISVLKKFNKECNKLLSPKNKLTYDDYYNEVSYIFSDKVSKQLAEELEKE